MDIKKIIRNVHENDIVELEVNPINKESRTFITHSKANKYVVFDFLRENIKGAESKITYYYLNNYDNINVPTVLLNNTSPDLPTCINLGYDSLNCAMLSFKTMFFPKAFKENHYLFSFYHELAHTSFYQRSMNTDLKDRPSKELHSDFFGLYFTLKNIQESEIDDVLDSYIKIRKSKIYSPKKDYHYKKSKKMGELFRIYYKQMDFNKSYEEVDKLAYSFVKALNKKKEKIETYFIF